jgi:hypothetical protein
LISNKPEEKELGLTILEETNSQKLPKIQQPLGKTSFKEGYLALKNVPSIKLDLLTLPSRIQRR